MKLRAMIFAGLIGLMMIAPGARGQTSKPSGAAMTAVKLARAHVVIFDFSSEGEFGKAIADSVRLRLARHEEFDVVDGITTSEASSPLAATAGPDKVRALMERLGVDYAVWGSVTKSGKEFKAELKCLDMTDTKKPVELAKTFTDSSERARGELARQIVEVVTGSEEWVPPQYGDEPEPAAGLLGKPVNANGGFEGGSAHWDAPDNVSTFIEDGPAGRGKVLRVRTDLERDAWLAYTRNIRLGLADPGRPPHIRTDKSYDSVAGLEGVHYRSEWIKASPGQRYWLTADHKGPGGAKVFVKGYRDMSAEADGLPEVSLVEMKLTPEGFAAMSGAEQKKLIASDARLHPERYRRECYRWYLNCGGGGKEWKHFAAPCPPRGGLPANVEWLQIQVYSYWPPGEYLWDNVNLYKDPAQKAPAKEEPARTPNAKNK